MSLFKPKSSKPAAGTPYDGVVVFCSDPDLVGWPGHYGVDADGQIDPSLPLSFRLDTDSYVVA